MDKLEHRNVSDLGVSGVNFAGYLTTESGVGAAARGYVRALRQLGLDLSLHDVSDLQINRSLDTSLELGRPSTLYDISMVCADIELHYAILDRLGDDFFAGRYNVGIWAWELPEFPEKWADRFAFFDEIWVGTSFVADALSAVSPIPVVKVPPVVEPPTPASREQGRRRLELADDEFAFLFVFDYHSHDLRKNPRATVEAFKQAFRPGDKVRLVIKCTNAKSSPEAFAGLRASADGYPITIVDGYLSTGEMRDLMAASDAYVSLHRSEGTGLTIAEAMALGKPVIATSWSGNTDFTHVNNSFPVQYELRQIERNVGPYSAGSLWAEPSIEHAAARLREVFEHPDFTEARGKAGRRTIEEHYSAKAVAGLMARRIETIQLRRHLSDFRDEKWTAYGVYRDLTSSIGAIAGQVLPRDAQVLVISKGDERLLRIDGCNASHFPCTKDGTYAGYYPGDSEQAINQLEAMRNRGAGFLLIPYTAYWWLDNYKGFAEHLNSRYSRVFSDDKLIIYDIGALPSLGSEMRLRELKPLAARVDYLAHLESDLRCKLLAESMFHADAAISSATETHDEVPSDGPNSYEEVVHKTKEIIRTRLPAGASLLIVTKGDPDFLSVEALRAQHFPQTDELNGVYAGHHPGDSSSAIAQLECLQKRGAEFLVFPGPSFWWLDFYAEFRDHLDGCYRRLWDDQDAIIYDLGPQEPSPRANASPLRRLRDMLGKVESSLASMRVPR